MSSSDQPSAITLGRANSRALATRSSGPSGAIATVTRWVGVTPRHANSAATSTAVVSMDCGSPGFGMFSAAMGLAGAKGGTRTARVACGRIA